MNVYDITLDCDHKLLIIAPSADQAGRIAAREAGPHHAIVEEATEVASLVDPVCRHCGSDELHAIEKRIEWRRVDWLFDGASGEWVTGENWGDEVGDSTGETVGVACGECYAEVAADGYEGKWNANDLILSREAYNDAHPPRLWRVAVSRWVSLPDGDHSTEREHAVRLITARDAREASELAGEYGMQDGLYPWRPDYPTTAVPAEAPEVPA